MPLFKGVVYIPCSRKKQILLFTALQIPLKGLYILKATGPTVNVLHFRFPQGILYFISYWPNSYCTVWLLLIITFSLYGLNYSCIFISYEMANGKYDQTRFKEHKLIQYCKIIDSYLYNTVTKQERWRYNVSHLYLKFKRKCLKILNNVQMQLGMNMNLMKFITGKSLLHLHLLKIECIILYIF